MFRRLYDKWKLGLSVLPIVALVVILKILFARLGWEILSLNALSSGLIAADVFLLGFLITGVLVDYKESERLPGDLAANLMAIFDEIALLFKAQKAPEAKECLDRLLALTVALKDWFYKKEHTPDLMNKLSELNGALSELKGTVETGTIERLKQEQSAMRRIIIRIRTIRGTFFVPSGYAIAEAINVLVMAALLMTKDNDLYESLFFIGVITFLINYMLALIRLLDNPFNYYGKVRGVEVISLLPLDEVEDSIRGFAAAFGASLSDTGGETDGSSAGRSVAVHAQ